MDSRYALPISDNVLDRKFEPVAQTISKMPNCGANRECKGRGRGARRELLRPPILCAACAGCSYFYQALASAGQEKIGIRNLDCVYLLI